MKLHISATCWEQNLMTALHEAKAMMLATDLVSMEIKVTKDGNHSWITITRDSDPHDVYKIFQLEQKIKELEKSSLTE